jgi:DNA-directed RNA polymerase specialized sigma24 family protein
MASTGSITVLLPNLAQGDSSAIEAIWKRYHPHLLHLARGRLQGRSRTASDEHDILQSVFRDLWFGARAGRFDGLEDRDSLWKLLVTLTVRKAANKNRYDSRLKRGGAANTPSSGDWSTRATDAVCSTDPEPPVMAAMSELLERLLNQLDDDAMRNIALWRLEGCTIEEIATRKQCVARTIRRKLKLIRAQWAIELADEPGSQAS